MILKKINDYFVFLLFLLAAVSACPAVFAFESQSNTLQKEIRQKEIQVQQDLLAQLGPDVVKKNPSAPSALQPSATLSKPSNNQLAFTSPVAQNDSSSVKNNPWEKTNPWEALAKQNPWAESAKQNPWANGKKTTHSIKHNNQQNPITSPPNIFALPSQQRLKQVSIY